MNLRNLLGATAVFLGLGGGITWWHYQLQDESIRNLTLASEAKVKNWVRVAGDDYLGYAFIQTPEMTRQALKRGLGVTWTEDGGDYEDRLKKFNAGAYDAIVLPVASYLQHGYQYNYPGVINASIAESKGADAILCFKDKLPTGKITDLNNDKLKIVYTAESPSRFLLDLTENQFQLFNLQASETWRVEVGGSKEVYEKAKKKEGDCFVLWEPDVSKALHDVPGLEKVWGSDQFAGFIDDVFVFNRHFANDHPDQVKAFYKAYFSTMRVYSGDHDLFIKDVTSTTQGLSQAEVEKMVNEIKWYNLRQDAGVQFGLDTGKGLTKNDGLLNTILSNEQVLVDTHQLPKKLPDPTIIFDGDVLAELWKDMPSEEEQTTTQRSFSALSDDDWKGLKVIGTLQEEPVAFSPGLSTLSDAAKSTVETIAKLLSDNYPDMRVVIKGNTGAGDEVENLRISQERAEAIKQELVTTYGISENRLKAVGMGSSSPPLPHPGESPKQRSYRFSRVELELREDNGF